MKNHGQRKCYTVQLNPRAVRRIDTKVCTENDHKTKCGLVWSECSSCRMIRFFLVLYLRSWFCRQVVRISDTTFQCSFLRSLHEVVVDVLVYECSRSSHTALPHVREYSHVRLFYRIVHCRLKHKYSRYFSVNSFAMVRISHRSIRTKSNCSRYENKI